MRNCERGTLLFWVPPILIGAKNLACLSLDVEDLPFLPMIRAKALKRLSVDTCTRDAGAASKLVQAIKNCQQLEELTIKCNPAHERGWVIPELDLRHLKHLKKCQFEGLLAPRHMFVLQGAIRLVVYTSLKQVTAWSELLRSVHVDLECIQIQSWPHLVPI